MQGSAKLRGWLRPSAMAALACLAAGCTTVIKDHRGYVVDQAVLDSVQPGIDNRLSVEKAMGRPTFVSQFGEPTWYYVGIDTHQPPFHGPHPVKETVLRVRFDATGNVLAVDRAAMEHVAHIRPDGDKTPTLGRKRSFLEDLFGNIGTVGAVPGGGQGGGGGGRGGGPNGS